MNYSDINLEKILIIESSDETAKVLLEVCISLGYNTFHLGNGVKIAEQISLIKPDLILLDPFVSGTNGFEVTEKLKSNLETSHIPVIILTRKNQKKDKILSIASGANDYITRPFNLPELTLKINNHLKMKKYHDMLILNSRNLENLVEERTNALEMAYEKLDNAYQEIRRAYIDTIQRLNIATEYKDMETGLHTKRISLYSRDIAFILGMDSEYTERIFYASAMHDIGKVGIPDKVLLKNGPLNEEEWEIMKNHTEIGYNILKGTETKLLNMASDIAYTHHEKYSGNGYPRGIKGDAIPLSGRIVHLVDQYDALRSERPYKDPLTHQEVLYILTKGDGRTYSEDFDPEILKAFEENHTKFEVIYQENS